MPFYDYVLSFLCEALRGKKFSISQVLESKRVNVDATIEEIREKLLDFNFEQCKYCGRWMFSYNFVDDKGKVKDCGCLSENEDAH